MISRYEIRGEIARGGMGVVYRAFDPALRQERALKVLLAGDYVGGEQVERFVREARALARLRHADIVGVYDVGFHDEKPFLVMDLVDGGSLSGLLEDRGALPVEEALRLVDRIARAMDYAHGEGIVHRDLKPANVLIDAEGNPRVTDFGLARDVEARDDLTRSGQVMGTPAYMPPEQASGELHRMGPRSDVYSIGAMLHQLIAGKRPFAEHAGVSLLNAIITKTPELLGSVCPGVPRDVETIVLTAMAKEPEDRYDSAAALAADIRRHLEGRPILARRATAFERVWSGARRHPVVAGLVVLLLALSGPAVFAAAQVRARLARAQAVEGEREALRLEDEAFGEEDGERRRGLLMRVTELAPDRVGAWRALARTALPRGGQLDLDLGERAVEALRRLDSEGGELDALEGRLRAGQARWGEAAAAFDRAIRGGFQPLHTSIDLARAKDGSGDAAAAIAALRAALPDRDELGVEHGEAIELRVALEERVGAVASADADRLALVRIDAGSAVAVDALARSAEERILDGDVDGLAGLWAEVHRILDGPVHRIVQSSHDDVLDALGEGRPDADRVRAALALAVFPTSGSLARAASIDRKEASPILAEALRATLIGRRQGYDVAAWAEEVAPHEGARGALAALTLLEVADELEPTDRRALLRLADAREPLLRASVPLAVAVAGSRGALEPDDAAAVLASFGRDEDARVAALARIATAALAILGDGDRGTVGEEDRAPAITLALKLARRPDVPDGATERARSALAEALAGPGPERASVELNLAAARLALEERSVEAALRHLGAAREAAPAPDPRRVSVLELEGVAAALADGATDDAATELQSLDPVAFARSVRREEVIRALGVVALPASNGLDDVLFDLDGRSEGALAAARRSFETFALEPSDAPDGRGLRLPARAYLSTRCRFDEIVRARADIEATESSLKVWLFADIIPHKSWGWCISRYYRRGWGAISVDGRAIDRFPQEFEFVPIRSVRLAVGRRGLTVLEGSRAIVRRALLPRLAPGNGQVYVASESAVDLARLRVRGRLSRLLPDEREVALARDELVPLDADRRLLALNGAPTSVRTVDELTRSGAVLPVREKWLAQKRVAPTLGVDLLRGDASIRARVRTDPLPRGDECDAGVAIVSQGSAHEHVMLAVGDPRFAGADARVWFVVQRGGWEKWLACARWDAGRPVVLELSRRGDVLIGRFGPSAEELTEIARVTLPLADPVEACLFTRRYRTPSGVAGPSAFFDAVELLVEPPR